jgi:hypothetical protein
VESVGKIGNTKRGNGEKTSRPNGRERKRKKEGETMEAYEAVEAGEKLTRLKSEQPTPPQFEWIRDGRERTRRWQHGAGGNSSRPHSTTTPSNNICRKLPSAL